MRTIRLRRGPAADMPAAVGVEGEPVYSTDTHELWVLHGGGSDKTKIGPFVFEDFVGPVTVVQGGTGQTSYTDGQLLIGNSTGNTLTKASLTAPAAGVTITGGGGSITFGLANDLAAVEGLASTGLAARTATDTWTTRTITGTADRITVTDGSGVSGNPTVDIAGTYIGQTSITTVGTITSGTWTGTTIAVANGGTGQTSFTDGQLLIGNTTGNTLAKATLTAGSGVAVTNGGGSITIATDPATQSDQETGTDTAKPVTAGRQHYHPSACKAFVYFTVSGTTVTVQRSYNVSSVTRSSTGVYVINFTTSFSDTKYTALPAADNLSGMGNLTACPTAHATGSCTIAITLGSSVLTDPSGCNFSAFGDQ